MRDEAAPSSPSSAADNTAAKADQTPPAPTGFWDRSNLFGDMGVNAGVTLKAPFKGRDNDVVGLAVGYAKIGSHAQGLASDTASLTTPGYPSRSSETIIEATYQYQVTPWWQLQADFQYAFRPAGGIPNPENPSQRVGNEWVLGVHTNIVF